MITLGEQVEKINKAQRELDVFKREVCDKCGHIRGKHYALVDGFDRFWCNEFPLEVCGKGACQMCHETMREAVKPYTDEVKGCRGFESFDSIVSELREKENE